MPLWVRTVMFDFKVSYSWVRGNMGSSITADRAFLAVFFVFIRADAFVTNVGDL